VPHARIRFVYGNSPVTGLLRGRREEIVLPGRGTAGSDPAGGLAPDQVAGEAPRRPAAGSLRAARLYRSAQRLLQLEEEIVNDLAEQAGGDLAGSFELGASTGPGGVVMPRLLCEFGQDHPELRIALSVFDTQTVIAHVADRALELGVVGAAPRHRGVEYEPFFRDAVVLACPPGHPFAGRTVPIDELRGETVVLMQDGAGVRQMIEDELRGVGVRLRDLDVHLELGLQESVTTAVRSSFGVTFISRSSIERDLAAGTLAEARVADLELEREIFLVRATGRSESSAARAFVEFAKERLT
jgi:DNA-binding transcriptional LysR family regulator